MNLNTFGLKLTRIFFFNGLNTIYGHIDVSNQTARTILLQFSDLLRYSLYDADVKQVELEKEILYIKNYVALQQARNSETLHISFKAEIENGDKPIAPLLFIAFIENAFKHVGKDEAHENSISIELIQDKNRVEFSCVNTYEAARKTIGGIGLTNIQRRLNLLYGEQHSLCIDNQQKIFKVNLTLSI